MHTLLGPFCQGLELSVVQYGSRTEDQQTHGAWAWLPPSIHAVETQTSAKAGRLSSYRENPWNEATLFLRDLLIMHLHPFTHSFIILSTNICVWHYFSGSAIFLGGGGDEVNGIVPTSQLWRGQWKAETPALWGRSKVKTKGRFPVFFTNFLWGLFYSSGSQSGMILVPSRAVGNVRRHFWLQWLGEVRAAASSR